jgi:hypothetical protein
VVTSLKDAARAVDWNKLQSQLEESDFDILFLFDCCYAMSMPNEKLKWRRRCEIVGSSGPRERAGGDLRHPLPPPSLSFLMMILRKLVKRMSGD